VPSSLIEKEVRGLRARKFTPLSNTKTALINVRIFNGHLVQEPRSVFIDGDTISFDADDFKSASVVDGQGGILLPGLIDSHCHVSSLADLENLTVTESPPR
jgi:imidazolonepropionase-like amidohydrolase